MNKSDKVLELVNEISSTIVEAGDVKVGDAVMFKPGTKLAGVIAIVQNIQKDNSLDVRIGGGDGLCVAVPAGDLLKTAGHPGILAPKA